MVENSITISENAVAQDDGAFSGQNNAQALSTLLNALEDVSLSQRDKGTRFERLVLDYFQYDKKFQGIFSKVQTYADWAAEHTDLAVDRRDIGIDLVATNTTDSVVNIDTTGGGTVTFGKWRCI